MMHRNFELSWYCQGCSMAHNEHWHRRVLLWEPFDPPRYQHKHTVNAKIFSFGECVVGYFVLILAFASPSSRASRFRFLVFWYWCLKILLLENRGQHHFICCRGNGQNRHLCFEETDYILSYNVNAVIQNFTDTCPFSNNSLNLHWWERGKRGIVDEGQGPSFKRWAGDIDFWGWRFVSHVKLKCSRCTCNRFRDWMMTGRSLSRVRAAVDFG